MRLLFVDDAPDDVELAALALRREAVPFEYRLVATREELFDALEREQWSAVISDYRMPGFSGAEVLAIVHELRPELPVILLSGAISTEAAVEAMRAGASDYVMKDDMTRLGHAIQREVRDAATRLERARLQDQLRRSEQRYRQIVDHAPIGIATTGIDGIVVSANGQYCSIVGRPLDDVLGRRFRDFLHPATVAEGAPNLEELIEGAGPRANHTQQLVRPDGVSVWTEVTASVVRKDDGTVEHVIMLVEEVTARKAAEERLRANKELLDEAQKIALIGSWEHDLVTGAFACSDQLVELYGLAPGNTPTFEEVASRIHPGDRAELMAKREAAIAHAASFCDDFRLTLEDGIHHLHTEGRIVRDDEGRAIRTVGIVQDITERVRREEELRRVAVQQAAVANVSQAALTTSLDFLFRQAALFVSTILEVEVSEILEKVNGDLRLRAGDGWPEGSIGNAKIDGSVGSQASYTMQSQAAVIMHDVAAETRFTPSPALVEQGIASGVTVVIESGEGNPWGVLGAYSRSRRTFTGSDVDFLRSMAGVLGQAIERERTDRALRDRALQQSAIAELGQAALHSFDDATLAMACELVRRGLRVDYSLFGSVSEDLATVRYAVGRWHPAVPEEVPVSRETQVGLTILDNAPVVVEDYGTDPRLKTGAAAREAGVVAGLTVPVASGSRIYGVLTAQTSTHRAFDLSDVDFMRSLANILAEALERDRGQRELEKLTRRLQLVLESTAEGMYTVDPDGRCTMINTAAARMLGRPAEDFIGIDMHELIHARRPDGSSMPRAECRMSETLHSGALVTATDDVFWRNDGTSFPVEYSAAPIIDADRRIGAVVSFTDITGRKKLEQKLEQANRLSSLGRLAATVAHEFNNVLMGIAPFLDLMHRQPERIDFALEQISRSVSRGKRISHEILRFTQPAEPNRSSVKLEPWLLALAAEVEPLLADQCALRIDIVDPGLAVLADGNQLHQIMSNLILNARDAMPAGGRISIAAQHEPSSNGVPGLVRISVSDDGIGMSAETLHHMFEPLFTTKKTGTGLGLAVVHQVVQQHGGDIYAESEVGKGTTVHVLLPTADEPAAQVRFSEGAGELPSQSSAAVPPRIGTRILLVEDDESVSAGLSALLGYEGFIVDVVRTGAAAMDKVNADTPDVVILDVGLPDVEGTQVYRQLSEMHPHLPVIFSTGHADQARLDEAFPGAPITTLLKPYGVGELLQTIESVLDA